MLSKIQIKLGIVLIVLSIVSYITHTNKELSKSPDYEQKILASHIMKNSIDLIKNYKIENGIPIDSRFDINNTGLIGYEITEITTTYGDLESKRTSTNPNFAAIIVDLFNELDLREGDTVAVNFSGSFPAINVAVLSALEASGIEAIIISTVGASTFGANDPLLTYLDMENILWENGLINNRSTYFSIGGANDTGLEFEEEVKNKIIDRLKSYNIQYLSNEDFEENIRNRYALYNNDKKIKAFISVGGNLVSFGKGTTIAYLPGGIVLDFPKNTGSVGLGQSFIADNVPIIHLLNIKDLAKRYSLPIDPVPIPDIGDGNIYFQHRYNKLLILFGIIISIYLLKGIKNENLCKDISFFTNE